MDYMPTRFEDIRLRVCNIDTKDYVLSLRETTKERFSEGASGAFLFFSADQKYIIKSMTEEEHHVLMDILPSYHAYLIEHPKSMLTKFVGCHSVALSYTGKVYFCVMRNIFYGAKKIHETYDLKGSWIDRAGALPSAKSKAFTECRFCDQWYRVGVRRSLPGQTCSVRPNGKHVAKIIFKDMDVNWKFELNRKVGDRLYAQLCFDADFLCSHGIMDYSLLIGVEKHRIPLDGSVDIDSDSESNSRYPAAFVTAPSSFTIGVIDVLQQYTWKKKVEHLWKTRIKGKGKHGISCVEHTEYADRFKERVCEAFIRPSSTSSSRTPEEQVDDASEKKVHDGARVGINDDQSKKSVQHARVRSNTDTTNKHASQRRRSVFDSNADLSMADLPSKRSFRRSNTGFESSGLKRRSN